MSDLADFVKGRVDKESDELQRLNLTNKDKEIAEKASKLIIREYGEVLKKLGEAKK